MELVFFGSGPVSKKSLDLLSKSFKIEAIITKNSTIDMMASLGLKVPILTADNQYELDELVDNNKFKSRLAVLIDFGIIISEKIINKFDLGVLNSHFSHLPEWRGADPITSAILSGQLSTGVSLMLIDKGMDTGKILVQKSIKINNNDSVELTERLIDLSNDLLTEYLPKYYMGNIKPRSQPHPDRATYSRKLTKQDGLIDWTKSANIIEREVRAYIEWPKSYTKLNDNDVIIKKVKVVNESGEPGDYRFTKKELVIYCGQDSLSIEYIQPAGKKEMPIEAFLAGYRL